MNSDAFFVNLQEFNTKYVEALQILGQKRFDIVSNPFMDMSNMQKAYLEAVTDFTNDPAKFFQHNLEYASRLSNLMFHFMDKMSGNYNGSLYDSNPRDKRFKDKAWQESMYFNFVKQFYLMSADWYRSLVKQLNIPNSQKKLLEFYTEQLLNAACPTNYANLNPEVINELVNSNGKNLLQGIENFVEDLKKSENMLSISTVEGGVFSLGKNIASTKGKVIYQNDLMQLICYKPKKQSFEVPIYLVPAWINKYYVLDLSPENSFVKFLVDKGFQVYLVSWINPGANLANKNYENYLAEGVLDPIAFLQKTFKHQKFNLLGYCLGGTLAASAVAYYETLKNNPFASSTFLTTLLDFSDPGELGLFINSQTIGAIKDELSKKGYLDGKYMSHAFNLLRANDLIWSFVVNNYLLGKKPMAFDLLYWNSDTTNLPAAMHSFYLDNMYINNALIKPAGIKLLGNDIDLSKISIPCFFLSTIDDHIAPWEATFAGFDVVAKKGMADFCLAGSGHIAGVINSPNNKKYGYWVNKNYTSDPNDWLKNATETPGSWWNYWADWLEEKSGKKQDSIDYEHMNFLESAPGSYVQMRNE